MSTSCVTLAQSCNLQFDLSVGGVPLRLLTHDEQLFSAARERYRSFVAAQDQPLAIHVMESLSEHEEPVQFAYDFDLHHAALRVSSREAQFLGADNPHALDNLLRILLTWALLQRTGFLLHAATVVRNGRAYVFTGPSGAGKSTVASLAQAGSVLTDELSLVRRENGIWQAYGTPFWGEFRAGESNSSAPVAGIFRLVQAPENRLQPLLPKDLLRAVMTNVLFFSRKSADSRRLLEIATQAAQELPGYNLEFRKDASFWKVLPS